MEEKGKVKEGGEGEEEVEKSEKEGGNNEDNVNVNVNVTSSVNVVSEGEVTAIAEAVTPIPVSKRKRFHWDSKSTTLLITYYGDMKETRTSTSGTPKSSFHKWASISERLRRNFPSITSTMCKDKWNNLMKKYKEEEKHLTDIQDGQRRYEGEWEWFVPMNTALLFRHSVTSPPSYSAVIESVTPAIVEDTTNDPSSEENVKRKADDVLQETNPKKKAKTNPSPLPSRTKDLLPVIPKYRNHITEVRLLSAKTQRSIQSIRVSQETKFSDLVQRLPKLQGEPPEDSWDLTVDGSCILPSTFVSQLPVQDQEETVLTVVVSKKEAVSLNDL